MDLCPRYFLTVDRLGVAKIATKLPGEEDSRLEAKWKHHPLWPRTAEQSPATVGSRGKAKIFTHFCPEVAFDTFGLFANCLAEYTDELDRDLAHETLGRSRVGQNDWRWQWSNVSVMHYSDCPLYSPLLRQANTVHGEGQVETTIWIVIKEFGGFGLIAGLLAFGLSMIQVGEYGMAVVFFFVASVLIPACSYLIPNTSSRRRAWIHRRSFLLLSGILAVVLFAVLGSWTWHKKGTQPWSSWSVATQVSSPSYVAPAPAPAPQTSTAEEPPSVQRALGSVPSPVNQSKGKTDARKTIQKEPTSAPKQQTNTVQQNSTGEGSPNVQGAQGDVTITVDQSKGKTEVQKPPEKKPKPEDK